MPKKSTTKKTSKKKLNAQLNEEIATDTLVFNNQDEINHYMNAELSKEEEYPKTYKTEELEFPVPYNNINELEKENIKLRKENTILRREIQHISNKYIELKNNKKKEEREDKIRWWNNNIGKILKTIMIISMITLNVNVIQHSQNQKDLYTNNIIDWEDYKYISYSQLKHDLNVSLSFILSTECYTFYESSEEIFKDNLVKAENYLYYSYTENITEASLISYLTGLEKYIDDIKTSYTDLMLCNDTIIGLSILFNALIIVVLYALISSKCDFCF